MNAIHKHIAFVSLGLVFLLLQTHNAMVDSWYYAACVKHHSELINSHHLFYNYAGYYWYNLTTLFFPNAEAIKTLNVLNAIAAVVVLYLFFKCLRNLKLDAPVALWLSLLCGVSYGFMRYACDAETYILPIVFSLASTLFYLKNWSTNNLVISGIFGAIAILFHQVHIWWVVAFTIGIFMSKPFHFKYVLWFTTPILLVPLSYWICFQNSQLNMAFFEFIIGEYGKGNAGIDLSINAILLALINLFRTILQVHGNQLLLLKAYPFLYAISLLMFCFTLVFALNKNLVKKPTLNQPNNYSKVFLLAFILQLVFAFISTGNAEFMVMLPFLIVLYLASRLQQFNVRLIKYLTISIFIWNTSFGIVPAAFLKINSVDQQVEYSKKYPMSYTLWKNKPLVENQLTYHYGFSTNRNQLLSLKTINISKIDSMLKNLNTIYTDFPNDNNVLSREKFVTDPKIKAIMGHYSFVKCDSFDNIYGKNYIYYIQKRMH